VRNEKLKVLQSIRPFNIDMMAHSVVRGQYGPGKIGDKDVPGYRQEQGVAANSHTETFVAAKVLIDNWRWAGVPFYLRTGKRLAKRSTEIVIEFRGAPHMVFRDKGIEPNRLILNIQPDEGISVSFGAKRPYVLGGAVATPPTCDDVLPYTCCRHLWPPRFSTIDYRFNREFYAVFPGEAVTLNRVDRAAGRCLRLPV